jgi:hypothetical protein
MHLRLAAIAVLMLLCGILTTVAAQRQGQRGQGPAGQAEGRGRGGAGAEFAGPPQGPDDVPIVEVVGCLSQGASNGWIVTNATEPVKAAAGFSRPEEMKAAEVKPLGTLQFPLIGLVEFNPAEHKGHRVVVKGLLIKEATTSRLNVTSLMTASASCSK